MLAADADRLRADILRLHAGDLKPAEIAEQLACARSTVYKVLASPGPDRRRNPAPSAAVIPPATVDEVRRLAADDRRFGAAEVHAVLAERARADADAPPVPSQSTIARLLREARAPAEPDPAATEPAGPPRDPLLPAYNRTASTRVHHMDLEPETALLRAVLREAVADLDRPGDPRARSRQREHVAALVVQLLRASLLVAQCSDHIPLSATNPVRAAQIEARTRQMIARLDAALSTSSSR